MSGVCDSISAYSQRIRILNAHLYTLYCLYASMENVPMYTFISTLSTDG